MAIAPPAQITAAPDNNLVKRVLAARQEVTPTCGWMNADPASPNICFPGQTCALNTFYSVHECCSGADCTDIPFPTACVGASTSCDRDCQGNPLIVKCPLAGLPESSACATRIWLGSIQFSGFGCTVEETTQTVYTTNSAGVGETASWYIFGDRAAVAPTSSASRSAPPTSSTPRLVPSTSSSTRSAPSTSPTSTTTRSSIPTNTGSNSGSNSSFDVVALAAALGAILGLGLLLILGIFVYRWRKRLQQRKSNNATLLSAFPKGSESDLRTYPASPAGKSFAASSTMTASPAVSSYRGSEAPDGFGYYHQTPFEVDGSNRVAELYGMRAPVEAPSQHAPTEAGSVSVFEAPAGTYQPMPSSYKRPG